MRTAPTIAQLKRTISESTEYASSSASSPLAKRVCADAVSLPILQLFRRDSVEAFLEVMGDLAHPDDAAFGMHQTLSDIVSSSSSDEIDIDMLSSAADSELSLHDLLFESLAPASQPLHAVASNPLVLTGVPPKNSVPALPHSRKEWTEWEDTAIREAVAAMGTRWRAIALMLPGRSDDSVRNRWLRLTATTPAPSRSKRQPSEKHRQGWSAQEDAIIASAVVEFGIRGARGTRWNRIAEQLPSKRTEHAIRNRWHRLQSAAAETRCSVALSDISLPLALSHRTSFDSTTTVELHRAKSTSASPVCC